MAPLSPSFEKGLQQAGKQDAILQSALDHFGYPDRWKGEAGFATLLKIITDQQLSVYAAKAIWNRLEASGVTHPQTFLNASEETLRKAGLSRSKIRYGRTIVEAINDKSLNLNSLASLDDEQAIAILIKIPGIGVWTAEIYLLYALENIDIFPAGDLVLQKAIQQIYQLGERPNQQESRKIAEKWYPFRGAVALFLWHSYENKKKSPAKSRQV